MHMLFWTWRLALKTKAGPQKRRRDERRDDNRMDGAGVHGEVPLGDLGHRLQRHLRLRRLRPCHRRLRRRRPARLPPWCPHRPLLLSPHRPLLLSLQATTASTATGPAACAARAASATRPLASAPVPPAATDPSEASLSQRMDLRECLDCSCDKPCPKLAFGKNCRHKCRCEKANSLGCHPEVGHSEGQGPHLERIWRRGCASARRAGSGRAASDPAPLDSMARAASSPAPVLVLSFLSEVPFSSKIRQPERSSIIRSKACP